MKDVIVITGAGQGLGQCIARALINHGYRVAITDVDEQAAVRVANELNNNGELAIGLKLDVMYKADFEKALDKTLEHFGQIAGLVNNAALTLTTPIMEISADEFDKVVNVNLRGTFFGCQVFGSHFANNGYGRIVNISSLAGQNGGAAAGAHYAASKGGIVTMTKVFAANLAAKGVTVNAIAPGPMDLPIVHKLVPEEKIKHLVKHVIPIKALGNPDYVGTIIAQLMRPDAIAVTGATWDINGGIYMR